MQLSSEGLAACVLIRCPGSDQEGEPAEHANGDYPDEISICQEEVPKAMPIVELAGVI